MTLSPVAERASSFSPTQTPERRRHLYGPKTDFLLLGGASLIAFPILLLLPAERFSPPLALATLALLQVLNHPHFAASYQIFYRDFPAKAFGGHAPALRGRYLFAGILTPLALALFFATAIGLKDVRLLGYAGNAMALLVGWHYAKQGYGMLMVDAALKRRAFGPREKQILLANGYAVWMLTWLSVNQTLATRDLWGLSYYALAIPQPLMVSAGVVAAGTTTTVVLMLARSWRTQGPPPWTGVMAYGVSLYPWLLLMRVNPMWLDVVPAFHSLQYLAVVGRYQAGAAAEAKAAGRSAKSALAGFAASAVLLGFLGFYFVPTLFDAASGYDQAVFGTTLFMFVFWIFINVHHFVMDSVMWRRENPDTRRRLFA